MSVIPPKDHAINYERMAARSRGKAWGHLYCLRDIERERREVDRLPYDDSLWQQMFGQEIIAAWTSCAHSWQVVDEGGVRMLDDAADPSDISLAVAVLDDGSGIVLFGGTLKPEIMEISAEHVETVRGYMNESSRHKQNAAEAWDDADI